MKWQEAIMARINHFTNNHHKFEANELHGALNTILRLVPSEQFDETNSAEWSVGDMVRFGIYLMDGEHIHTITNRKELFKYVNKLSKDFIKSPPSDPGKDENKNDYWKERCLAAEKIVEISGIVDCAGFDNWKKLKQQSKD